MNYTCQLFTRIQLIILIGTVSNAFGQQQEYVLLSNDETAFAPYLAVSNDGQYLAVNWGSNSTDFWEITAGKRLKRVFSTRANITALAFSPDGKKLAGAGIFSRSNKDSLRILSFPDGKILESVPVDSNFFLTRNIVFNPDGNLLIASGNGMSRWGWQLEEKQKIDLVDPAHRIFTECICTLTDSLSIRCVDVWQTVDFQLDTKRVLKRQSYKLPKGAILPNAWAFSPDGRYFAIINMSILEKGRLTPRIDLVDLQRGEIVRMHLLEKTEPKCLAFSTDGRQLAIGDAAGSITILDVASWQTVFTFSKPDAGYVGAIRFLPDSDRILAAYHKRVLHIWETKKNHPVLSLYATEKGYTAISSEGYYNANQGGLTLIGKTKGNVILPLNKFDNNRRDFLLGKPYASSFTDAIRLNAGFPALKWLKTPKSPVEEKEVELWSQVVPSEPLLYFSVYCNNQLVLKSENPPGDSLKVKVPLQPGNNKIFIEIANSKGVAKTEVLNIWHRNLIEINHFAVIFAMDDPTLPFALREADSLAYELSVRYGFETEVIRDPDYNKFSATLEKYRLKKYSPNDHLFIYFTGHGSLDGDVGRLNLANSTFLPHSELLEDVEIPGCQHILLFIDACYSGVMEDAWYKGKPEKPAFSTISQSEQLESLLDVKPARYFFAAGEQRVIARTNTFSDLTKLLLDALRNPKNTADYFVRTIELKDEITRSLIKAIPRSGFFGNHHPDAEFIFLLKK